MKILTADEVAALHTKIIKSTGGTDGLRDPGLLESAVNSVYTAYGDYEKYPTIEEKAARLAFSLINDHAFIDGNKRIGVVAMFVTLEINKLKLSYSQKELIDLGLSVANRKCGYEGILAWIKAHIN